MYKFLKYLRFYLNKFFLLYLPHLIYNLFPDNFKDLSALILFYANNTDNFFFIQIGSNDGITGDPIHHLIVEHNFRGILIEPVSYLYKRLMRVYANNKKLTFKNIAIAEKNGYKKFYRLKKNNETNNPFWYEQIGSFNKNVVLKHKKMIPNFDKYFIEEKIKCSTFKNLIKENRVKFIDLLHIDTEGYDYEIIKMINFNNIKPQMILYENKHLSFSDKKCCLDLLKHHGYKIIDLKEDTFAHL